jgi:hypothetical protein
MMIAKPLVEQSPEREELEELTDGELLRKAARRVLIAVCVVAHAMLRREDLATTRIGEVAVLLRALSDCLTAATTTFERDAKVDHA